MKKIIDTIKYILIVALFVIAGAVALYIVQYNSAPWSWIATYWITLTAKNCLDLYDK